ncbi:hypothetical protein CFI11_21955 [Thalassococcus sp. S3]|nr:hypothetical protein CFI11_21955 [Thalassococcus sp. S3]
MDPNDGYHALLDKLRAVRPVWVDGYGDGTLVRWDDVAPDLMALILEVARKIEPFTIGDAQYTLPLEWVLAAEDAWRLITTRMRLRSLELAVIGPIRMILPKPPYCRAGCRSGRSMAPRRISSVRSAAIPRQSDR